MFQTLLVDQFLKAKSLKSEVVRNVAIIAHIDAGKTTTTEAMLFNSGQKLTRGSVDGGTTTTDYLVQDSSSKILSILLINK